MIKRITSLLKQAKGVFLGFSVYLALLAGALLGGGCEHLQTMEHKKPDLPNIKSVSFVGHEFAGLLTKNGGFLRTESGGREWETVLQEAQRSFDLIYFWDSKHGWAVSNKDQVWHSDNGGRSWKKISLLRYHEFSQKTGRLSLPTRRASSVTLDA